MKYISKIIFFLCLTGSFFQFNLSATAQESAYSSHVQTHVFSSHTAARAGDNITLSFTFKIDPLWHIYWKNAGDAGLPTEVHVENPLLEATSPLYMPTPIKFMAFDSANYGYKNEVTFWQDFKISEEAKTGPININVKTHYLSCKDICVPGSSEISYQLMLKNTATMPPSFIEKIQQQRKKLPLNLAEDHVSVREEKTSFFVTLKEVPEIISAQTLLFIPEKELLINDTAPQTIIEKSNTHLVLKLEKDKHAKNAPLSGILKTETAAYAFSFEKNETYETNKTPLVSTKEIETHTKTSENTQKNAAEKTGLTLAIALIFAFLGGIILNLMPCVLPVLSLKIMGLMHHVRDQKPYMHGIFYLLGIFSTFFVLASLLILLRSGGEHIGWGFQLQSPLFVAGLTLLMLLVSLQLLGFFEIGVSLTRLGKFDKGYSYTSTYISGILMTLVATPCTAPFMASSLGFALTQPKESALLIFLSLGFGLGFPYFILTLFPRFSKFLPKPGKWENTLKKGLSLPMFLTTFWLLWVFLKQTTTEETVIFIVCLLVTSLITFVYGKRRMGSKIYTFLWITSIIGTLFIVFIGNQNMEEENTPVQATTSTIKWQPWTKEKEQQFIAEGKTVFVNFSADWCITCKFNERLALTEKHLKQYSMQKNIVFLKGDWTKKDTHITQELEAHQRAGVPLYLLYKADKSVQVLPQILTPFTVHSALKE